MDFENEKMIVHKTRLRPRYGEVDQMGYVYHANYVGYCHMARTELLREYGINDSILEENNIILPVISMDLRYIKPAHYDEMLTIKTTIRSMPEVRFTFEFEICNQEHELVCTANSTVVFANKASRKPMKAPEMIADIFKRELNDFCI